MVGNPDKCSFMLLGVVDSLQINLVCGDEILRNTKQEKVLTGTLVRKLSNLHTARWYGCFVQNNPFAE